MAYSVGAPGSAEWWLHRLVQRLMDRAPRIDLLEAYYEGNHPVPKGEEEFAQALKHAGRMARTNIYGMATKAPIERMRVKFFRIDGEVDQDAARVWSANNMDYQAPIMNELGASLGDVYGHVLEPNPDNLFAPDIPVITTYDPRVCITEEDPANPQITRAALRMWQDDTLQRVIAEVYLQGGEVHQFVGPNIDDCKDLDRPGLTKKLLSGQAGGGLQEFNSFRLKIPVVPIVRGAWRPTVKGISFAECEDAIDIQDRINQTTLDRIKISYTQAYRQRWAKGVKIPENKNGVRKPPFDPGPGKLWVSGNPDAEFGEFTEADLNQITEAIQDDIGTFAAVTKTPAHYLTGKLSNVSGSTLTQAEAGLSSKTKQRQIAMGWFHERLMRICFLYMGLSKATSVDFEVEWEDPELHSRVDLADAFAKETAGGLDPVIAAERLGLKPDQLKRQADFQAKQEEAAAEAQSQELALKKEALKSGRSQPPGSGGKSSSGSRPSGS